MKHYKVVIIGAGTAGLSARRQVEKVTDDYVVIDDGPLGTTCARVGCMPSKVLIQVANDYHRRHVFDQVGISGGQDLGIDTVEVMKHVRALRDRFVRGVKSPMGNWESKLLRGRATFVDQRTLKVGDETITADKIIVAAGSRPIVPKPWLQYRDHLIDTDGFFELEDLPKKVAIIGLGVIGIELGQALHRLGVEVIGITMGKEIGGLTDPGLQEYVAKKFGDEFPLHFNGAEILGTSEQGKLQVKADGQVYEVDKALVTMGRRNNLDRTGFENTGIVLSKSGIPEVDPNNMQVVGAPHIFLPGDNNGDRPILHEAADEGFIAGFNAVNPTQCFKRKVNFGITFSDPSIATIGKRHAQLVNENTPFVTGEVSFEGQGRSIVKLKEQGLLHLYASKSDGVLLGAELQAPNGEHLAHLLAWAISARLTVEECLKMPFYHPVIEEGLRTALRDCLTKLKNNSSVELARCEDPPIR